MLVAAPIDTPQSQPRLPRRHGRPGGFTYVEMVAVIICLALAAALVLPSMSNTASTRLAAAADMIIADLEFAQTQTLARADDPRLLVFDPSSASYFVAARSDPATPLVNQVGGEPYLVHFGTGRGAAAAGVGFGGLEVGTDNALGFGAVGQLDQTTVAAVRLECEGRRLEITLDPVTGSASVSHIQ
jgi:type II secretory pathway pseudopilin PulG